MKLFYSIIISLLSIAGYSQTILHQNESTTRTVQDPQTVIMAPGFKASSGVSNPFIAKIGPGTENPGGGPSDSQAGANNPSGTSAPLGKSFHDTKGNIDVNGGGQLQFTLPIELPQGIRSVAPQINLMYSSGSGNGIAGYGWNLSGITSISRVGRRISKDSEVKSIQLDYTDYYTFNGQRLILKSGEYGKDGAEYVTEKFSNIKIKSVGSSQSAAAGPMYFHVLFEDGTQAWYGDIQAGDPEFNSRNGRSSLEYNIVKWIDNKGNFINYHYDYATGFMQGGVCNISYIEFGGNEQLNKPHFNRIDFNYIVRALEEESYVGGFRYVQNKLLKDILITTNNNQYKKYSIDYFSNGTSYQFVNQITEYNSNNEAANPIKFEYPTPTAQSLEYSAAPNNIESFENIRISGDFNGDSYVDFVMNNGIIKLGAFNDGFTSISTNKIFSTNAKVVSTLIDSDGQIFNGNGIVQYEGGKVEGYIFKNNTFVKIFEKNVLDVANCANCVLTLFEVGDVDGDGISDVILTLKGGNGRLSFVSNYIVDLKSSDNPLSTWSPQSFRGEGGFDDSLYTSQQYMDVDGDGKVDVINVSDSQYTVFYFEKNYTTHYLKKIKFTGNLAENRPSGFPVLFGDFNGDGNIDFTIPTTNNQNADNWRFYMGTEKGFANFLKTNFVIFRKEDAGAVGNNVYRHFYSISDINKDGKSDIIHIKSYNNIGQQNSNGSSSYRTFGYDIYTHTTLGSSSGQIQFSSSSNFGGHTYTTLNWQDYNLFVPITSQMRVNNNYYDVFLFWKERLHKLKSPTAIGSLAQIKTINQGNIPLSIAYKELNPTTEPTFYKKSKSEYYPYFSLARVDQTYAVSKLSQAGRMQDFRYRGMTGHMQGKGSLGFHQIARSTWYASGFENTVIWTGTETDSQLDGLPIKDWSIKTTDETKIFPSDISENNNQLLTFKSTIYQNDLLLNGQTYTGIVSATERPLIVDAIIVKNTKTKEFLKDVVTNTSIIYGEYYLPQSSVTSINNGYATTTSSFEYSNNISGTGADYFIGRPKNKNEIVQAYGDTKSLKEEYTYENNLLKTLKSWNRDNSGYLLETYNHDGFGNITQKVITNSVDNQIQSVSTQYDARGRFVIKKLDNLGLETNVIYNEWGQVLEETNFLGNKLISIYDGWGKLLKAKTNLSGTTTYEYHKDNDFNIIITKYSPDGKISKTYTNKFGEDYKFSTKAFDQGKFVSSEIFYDAIGRKIKESEPYFSDQAATKWNLIAYDDSIYPPKATAISFNGKQLETSVSGLTTTVKELNGYSRTSYKISDPIGNCISSTDKGGTISFTYNAVGEQIKSQYGENIVTTKYDSWGRKSEFYDPSNGTYKYEYNGLGLPKKLISPKGFKEYVYNQLGQAIQQVEIATNGTTNKNIVLTYDSYGRVINKSGTSKGKFSSISLSYDPQGRLLSSSENSNGKYYIQKGITYDDNERIISYEKSLYSSGTVTKAIIENEYSGWSGELFKIKDKDSGKILWELQSTNSKGQVISAKLGQSTVNNIFDSNGFLSNINHSSQLKPSIIQIAYSFNAIKNELNSRATGGDFNINETFDYDDNNRLVNWTNPVTGNKPNSNRNIYDVKGRILENDQVGTMKYENSSKVYQQTGMTLNAAGSQNYNNDLIQGIAYNENNDPVFIDGEFGDVAFEYGLTNMRQRVTYGGNFNEDQEGEFTKFYSENGSFEILRDNTTGNEKHVLYIGGSPYESNIIVVKNFTTNTASYNFLHKDYIGSILAVSDDLGQKIEQRHFDAWGNFTHLQIGNGAIITDKNVINSTSLLLDRGYTSHEHFGEIGIIHMNGRLYDPLLRRFLNADENIQDPFNTQNYNKYGYVLNNPLMFNDPSGEFFFLAPVFAYIAANAIVIGTGALIGAAMGAIMYVGQAIYSNSWSWGGFGKAILTGAITGTVSAGAGQIFSAAGFWATVGNGAIAGAASGGVTSIIKGTNILQGILKGAVIGGAVAGVSYAIRYSSTSGDENKLYESDIAPENTAASEQTSSGAVPFKDKTVTDLRAKEFGAKGMKQWAVEGDHANSDFYKMDANGYFVDKDGSTFLAYTQPKANFWTGRSSIYYAKTSFESPERLLKVMKHETVHAFGNSSAGITLAMARKIQISYGVGGNRSTIDLEHLVIRKAELSYLAANRLSSQGMNTWDPQTISNFMQNLTGGQLSIFRIIFNRINTMFSTPTNAVFWK
jgi:RHS repeat-associated protein